MVLSPSKLWWIYQKELVELDGGQVQRRRPWEGGGDQGEEGEGCVQVVLDGGEAGHSAAQAVSEGHSVLWLENVASAEECAMLHAEAREFASKVTRTNLDMCSVGRVREPVVEMLQAPGQAGCEELLRRALHRVAVAVPGLLERVFGEQTAQSFE